jgi:hypothetical protein
MCELLAQEAGKIAIDSQMLWYVAIGGAVLWWLRSSGSNQILDQVLGVLRGLLNWPAGSSGDVGDLEADGADGLAARAAAAARLGAWLKANGMATEAKQIDAMSGKWGGK